MNKKIAFVLVIILAIAAGALLYFYKNNITTQSPEVVDTAVQNQPATFSLLDDKDFSDSTKTESYKIGASEFKIYLSDVASAPEGYFEVYQNGNKIFTSKPNYNISGLLSFSFGDNKYVVIKDYSGGAHCCDTDYIFRINKAGEVKLIRTFDMGNATISKDSLLVKNGKLYLVLTDDTFQYFHVAYAYSYFFTQYFKLDGDNIVMANNDFSADIIKTAEDCKAKIATDSAQLNTDTGNYWLNDAVCYVANYSLVGKQATALAEFDGFFNKFFPTGTGKDAFGETITRAGVKKEIDESTKTNDRFN